MSHLDAWRAPRSGLPESRPPAKPTESRAEAGRFYASTRWRKLRANYLRQHPLCADCEAAGLVQSAREVHHKQPRRDRPDLAFAWSNLEGLCKPCHSRRTAKGE